MSPVGSISCFGIKTSRPTEDEVGEYRSTNFALSAFESLTIIVSFPFLPLDTWTHELWLREMKPLALAFPLLVRTGLMRLSGQQSFRPSQKILRMGF